MKLSFREKRLCTKGTRGYRAKVEIATNLTSTTRVHQEDRPLVHRNKTTTRLFRSIARVNAIAKEVKATTD
jgi:hypothetical protein